MRLGKAETEVAQASKGLHFRLAGFPVDGISGVFYDIGDVRAHENDERVSVQSFYEGVEFMYPLMKERAR